MARFLSENTISLSTTLASAELLSIEGNPRPRRAACGRHNGGPNRRCEEIALSSVFRRRLRKEVLSGRVAQLEKQAVGVLSRFVVANDMDADVKRAFVLRPHLVDGAAGFVRMDVLSPEDMPNEIWLMTYWADIASYRTWHKSHAYHESHAGIPKGLKLVPGSATLRIFNLIAS